MHFSRRVFQVSLFDRLNNTLMCDRKQTRSIYESIFSCVNERTPNRLLCYVRNTAQLGLQETVIWTVNQTQNIFDKLCGEVFLPLNKDFLQCMLEPKIEVYTKTPLTSLKREVKSRARSKSTINKVSWSYSPNTRSWSRTATKNKGFDVCFESTKWKTCSWLSFLLNLLRNASISCLFSWFFKESNF